MYLIADSFMFSSQLGLLLHLFFLKGIKIFFMPDFLLFLRHFDGSNILLEFSFLDSVFILNIFQGDMGFFLKISKLIKVVEDQVLAPLSVDLKFDLMLLAQVLKLSFFVSQLSCFIFQLLLANKPEVVDSEPLIVEEK